MINLKLDRNDVVCLIRGSFVPYELMDFFEKKKLGSYTGGFNDRWNWNSHSSFEKYSIEELVEFFNILKENK